jgi:carbamoyl-phosphate synthase small subunit
VFNTSLVGYIESLTDPSYRGQILVLTYPLIGNYGVPAAGDPDRYESDRLQVSGLVVATAHDDKSHAGAARSLPEWLAQEQVPGVQGIDTRRLTLHLRERGTMLGRIVPDGSQAEPVEFFDPNRIDIVKEVCLTEPRVFGAGAKRVVLVDCGAKHSIRRELLRRGVDVLQVPAGHDYTAERFDGILVSNGPGNPELCRDTIGILRRALALAKPVFGICLGCQLIALAAGARTYKLPYGHRGSNQPCRERGTNNCRLTSQNHGYAVDAGSLPADWQVWFENANDGSVEGIRHRRRPVLAVQFHPEARPGPLDSRDLFDEFVAAL